MLNKYYRCILNVSLRIVLRIGKDGLENRMGELEQSMISRQAVRVSCMAPICLISKNVLKYTLFDDGL